MKRSVWHKFALGVFVLNACDSSSSPTPAIDAAVPDASTQDTGLAPDSTSAVATDAIVDVTQGSDSAAFSDAAVSVAAEGVAVNDSLRLPKNFRVHALVLANDNLAAGQTVSIQLGTEQIKGVARANDDGSVTYEPPYNWVGQTRISYRVLSGFETLGRATVTVDVIDEDWLAVGERLYRVDVVDAQAPLRGAPADHVTRINDSGPGWLTGTKQATTELSGFVGAIGKFAKIAVPGGISATPFHVSSLGAVAGSFVSSASGATGAFVIDPEGQVRSFVGQYPFLSAQGVNSNGDVIGAASDNARWPDMLRHAVTFSMAAPDKVTALPLPACTKGSLAASISDEGRVVGTCNTEAATHGFLLKGQSFALISPPGAVWSQAHDIDNNGVVVGTFASSEPLVQGFEWKDGVFETIALPHALQTHLLGAGMSGLRTGAWLDSQGFTRGLVLHPVSATAVGNVKGVQKSQEPENYHIQHACGHTTQGPFGALIASDSVATAPSFSAAHVTYRVALPALPDGHHGGWVRLKAASAGVASLYITQSVPLRLTRDSGETHVLHRAERTRGCPTIKWIQEFQIDKPETLPIWIGPSIDKTVEVTFERVWIYD